MKQNIKLNNVIFEVKKSKGELHPIRLVHDLGDCYKNPSSTKIEIFDHWYNYTIDFLDDDYRVGRPSVMSYNTFTFTIGFNIYDCDWKFIGIAYITRTHNYLYLVR